MLKRVCLLFVLVTVVLAQADVSTSDQMRFTEQPPNLTPPIPLDVFHLIDQSGSIDEETYLGYLDFAQSVSMALGKRIGYDTKTTPGVRVSVLGFGCKLSSTKDQTEFFLLQDSNEETINQKFQAARSEDYHPRYSRTCLRYAVEHVENAILSPVIAKAREPQRKTVILLYTDGKNGDFAWPSISSSPLFNNEKLVEVFAVGVDKRQVSRITTSIVKDAAHVFTSTSEDTLKAVSARLENFVIDPFGLSVSLLELAPSEVNDLGEVSSAEVCIGKQLRVSFKPASKEPAVTKIIDAFEIDANKSIKQAKLELLSIFTKKELDTATRVSFLKDMKETADAVELANTLKSSSYSVGKALLADFNYLCVFETTKQSITTLATKSETSETKDSSVYCDIPTTLFRYEDYEEIRIQIYRTQILDTLNPYELFKDVMKSFNVLVKWNTCSEVTTEVISSEGCGETFNDVTFMGDTLTKFLPAIGWKPENSVCIVSEVGKTFAPIVKKDRSIVCRVGTKEVFYSSLLESGVKDLQLTVTLQTEDPLSGNTIILPTTVEIENPKDTNCVSAQQNAASICFGEDFVVDFILQPAMPLLTLDKFMAGSLRCETTSNIFVKAVVTEGEAGEITVQCKASSHFLQAGEQFYLTVQGPEDSSIHVLTQSNPLSFNTVSQCIQTEVVRTTNDCEISSNSFNGVLTFTGDTIEALRQAGEQLECVVVNIDRRNTFIPVEYVDNTAVCKLKKVENHELRLKVKDSSMRLFSNKLANIESTCVDYHLLLDGSRVEATEMCLNRDLAVNIVDGHVHFESEKPLECLWKAGNKELLTKLEYEVTTKQHLCLIPKSIELLQAVPTQLSVVHGNAIVVENAFQLPIFKACADVVDFGHLEDFSLKSALDEVDRQSYPYNCERVRTEVAFDGTFIKSLSSSGEFLCYYMVDDKVVAMTNAVFDDSVYQCAGKEPSNNIFSKIDKVELVYEDADLQLAVATMELKPEQRELCSKFSREQNCSDAASFIFTGPSLNSILIEHSGNASWVCELVLENHTTFPVFSEHVAFPKERAVYGSRCSIDRKHYSFLDDAHDLEALKKGLLTLKLVESGETLLELNQELNMTGLRACMLTAFEKPLAVTYKPFFSGFLGAGAMFILVAALFAYSRRQKVPTAGGGKSHRSTTTVSSLTIEEDLVETLAEKEYFLYNATGFGVNDVVEVNLETSIDVPNKLGIILNKTLKGKSMTYEVKLLDEDNVVVTDLNESDLQLFKLSVGETVYVLDEEIEDQWNESTVVVFDQRNRTCDIRQESSRINDVPLVCIRKAIKQKLPEVAEIKVNVPHMSQQSRSLPKDLFAEPGILKKSSLKKLKNTNSARRNLNRSFNDKRVKFASSIPPPTYFSVPSEAEHLLRQKSFYETEPLNGYKDIGNGFYEVCVDISKGIGVCWVFDPIDGSILVGKFVHTNSGTCGPLERTGKVELKDKLVQVDGKSVNQYKSLSQVKDLIKKAKRRDKFVSFRLERYSNRV